MNTRSASHTIRRSEYICAICTYQHFGTCDYFLKLWECLKTAIILAGTVGSRRWHSERKTIGERHSEVVHILTSCIPKSFQKCDTCKALCNVINLNMLQYWILVKCLCTLNYYRDCQQFLTSLLLSMTPSWDVYAEGIPHKMKVEGPLSLPCEVRFSFTKTTEFGFTALTGWGPEIMSDIKVSI